LFLKERKMQLTSVLRTFSKNRKVVLMGAAAVAIVGFSAMPGTAQTSGGTGTGGLDSSIANINKTMTALEGIAETGVSIVVVPFGIGFALKIAGHVLRAGT
jgi:hypothetical protein